MIAPINVLLVGISKEFEKSLYKNLFLCYSNPCSRGISAAGSAPHWQCGGQRFESAMLHGPGSLGFPGFFLCLGTLGPSDDTLKSSCENSPDGYMANPKLYFGFANHSPFLQGRINPPKVLFFIDFGENKSE